MGFGAAPSARPVVASYLFTSSASQPAQYGLQVCSAGGCTSSEQIPNSTNPCSTLEAYLGSLESPSSLDLCSTVFLWSGCSSSSTVSVWPGGLGGYRCEGFQLAPMLAIPVASPTIASICTYKKFHKEIPFEVPRRCCSWSDEVGVRLGFGGVGSPSGYKDVGVAESCADYGLPHPGTFSLGTSIRRCSGCDLHSASVGVVDSICLHTTKLCGTIMLESAPRSMPLWNSVFGGVCCGGLSVRCCLAVSAKLGSAMTLQGRLRSAGSGATNFTSVDAQGVSVTRVSTNATQGWISNFGDYHSLLVHQL